MVCADLTIVPEQNSEPIRLHDVFRLMNIVATFLFTLLNTLGLS